MIPEDGQGKGRTAGGLGPLFSGLIAATLIALTLLVAVALGMGEQDMIAQIEPSPTDTAAPPIATPSPSATSTFTPVPSPTFTPTSSPTATSIETPTPGRTLTPEETPTPRPTPTQCIQYPWWGRDNVWVVKRNDTLYSISIATRTTLDELRNANCITGNNIYTGQRLYVRYVPPTPKPTIPPPVIKTFTLDPANQVIVDECIQIDWVVQGTVEKITLSAATGSAASETLVSDAPETGSHSDCPTAIGTRKYTLRAAGPDSSSQSTKSIEVVDESVQPTAGFSGSPTSGEEPLDVSFAATYTGIVTAWSWDFGDGGSSTAQNPSHTYAAAGDYTVSLTVTGPGGSDTETKTNYISVSEPLPPVAAFSGSPTSGEKPLVVSFTDNSTGIVTAWSWDFGDGGSSTAQNPSHTYADAGDYTVSLTVTGPGGSDTETKTNYVRASEPLPPVAAFSGSPTSGEKPLAVSFTDNSTGSVTSWSWSFGDGGSGTAQNPGHNYAAAGDYTVSLTVTGPGGSDTATKTNYISVSEPLPPVAAFAGSPTSGEKPLAVSFTDKSTGLVTAWSWSFGDGGSSAAQNPSHTFAAAGDYTVSLTVTGPGGSDTATKTNYISVSEPTPPVAAFSGSPTSGEKPLAVSFTDNSTGSVTSWSWSFGDGGSGTAQNPDHSYAAAGDYTVSLTVTGPGGSDTATRTNYIHVSEPAPAAAGAHGQAFLLLTTREPAIAALPRVQELLLAT